MLPTFSPKPKGGLETEEPNELSNDKTIDETPQTDLIKGVDVQEQESQEEPASESNTVGLDEMTEEYNEDDDDGEWITPENLQEEIIKDKMNKSKSLIPMVRLLKWLLQLVILPVKMSPCKLV